MDSTVIDGFFVSAEERAYGGFTDSSGRSVAPGVTRWLWLITDLNSSPVGVKVRDEEWAQFQGLAFGSKISVQVELRARNNRIERTLLAVRELQSSAK